MFNPKSLLLLSQNKFNIGKCHYVTGKDISIFSNLICVENSLTNLTCNCKNILSNKFRAK